MRNPRLPDRGVPPGPQVGWQSVQIMQERGRNDLIIVFIQIHDTKARCGALEFSKLAPETPEIVRERDRAPRNPPREERRWGGYPPGSQPGRAGGGPPGTHPGRKKGGGPWTTQGCDGAGEFLEKNFFFPAYVCRKRRPTVSRGSKGYSAKGGR